MAELITTQQHLQDAQQQLDANRLAQARRSLRRALALAPGDASVLIAVAKLWRQLGDGEQSRNTFQAAIKVAPDSALAWNGLGATWIDDKNFIHAEKCFRKALALKPGLKMAENNLAQCLRVIAGQMHTAAGHADWTVHDLYGQQVLAAHRARRQQGLSGLIAPFSVLGFQLSPEAQRDAAESCATEYATENQVAAVARPSLSASVANRRIRVGYLSADFRNNAAAHLMHRLFDLHDRDRFEVFAYSMGADDDSFYRNTIKQGAEHFVDIAAEQPADSARRIAADGIDILIDMMGFAGNHRAEICARRPAPIQIFWLGYCCTTGAPWIDYFIADPVVAPPGSEAHFSEQLLRLPNSYQMYCGEDFSRIHASRSDEGLPETAMVYCSFNMTNKIDPAIFSCWMRVLAAVPNSVLWLIEAQGEAPQRLRESAARQGIDPNRLIFADYKPKVEHLARTALADLFLDTTLFGAHTTASDALWAGVPVLTCPGALFAQRVAASVCTAAGLPDLIVNDMAQYESEAIRLGNDPQARQRLSEKLKAGRTTAPLFQDQQFVRDIESIYSQLINTQQ